MPNSLPPGHFHPPPADTYFIVVDLHAITLPHQPAELLAATRGSAALYIACGIDPERSSIFVQVPLENLVFLFWVAKSLHAEPLGGQTSSC